MKRYYGYARVSTAKQGEKGVSLQEQRDAIGRYAEKNGLTILDWFEERETAAKRGRPVFGRMMKLLGQGKAEGVVIHKIDRSARNLKDWADLGELIDRGIEVHFANESLDLHSRGGRLSADIQAVVAADYIRNLKEEAKKGIYGRLKQGVWPMRSPLGYLDRGAGKPKELDPATAPLLRRAFEIYASGRFSLYEVTAEMRRLGLRNRTGGELGRNSLSVIFNNPFYIGLMRIKRNGQLFEGAHEPLVKKSLFDRVQAVLKGKLNDRILRHEFVYRRLFKCAACGKSLIGELKKGHVYYRCHTRECPTTGVREEAIDDAIAAALAPVRFSEAETRHLRTRLERMRADRGEVREKRTSALTLQLAGTKERLDRLTDAFLDGVLEREMFEERKTSLLMERKELESRLTDARADSGDQVDELAKFLELANGLQLSLEMADAAERRELVEIATSNRRLEGKYVAVEPSAPFAEVAKRGENERGGPQRDIPRTWNRVIDQLLAMADDLPRRPRPPENIPEVPRSTRPGAIDKFGKSAPWPARRTRPPRTKATHRFP